MSDIIPPSITEGQKKGFSSPDASWFREESAEFLNRRFSNTQSNLYQYLDKNAVSNLVTNHLNGTQNHRLLIWSLLSFDALMTDNHG